MLTYADGCVCPATLFSNRQVAKLGEEERLCLGTRSRCETSSSLPFPAQELLNSVFEVKGILTIDGEPMLFQPAHNLSDLASFPRRILGKSSLDVKWYVCIPGLLPTLSSLVPQLLLLLLSYALRRCGVVRLLQLCLVFSMESSFCLLCCFYNAACGAEETVVRSYVSIRQHTSAYVSIRQHTSAYVSIPQHTSTYAARGAEETVVRAGIGFGI
jgi:hypothetical protein